MKYAERQYRDFAASDRWTAFRVRVETTDLYIRADRDRTDEALAAVRRLREDLRRHIERQNEFMTAFDPVDELADVPPIVTAMYRASRAAGVGPMAAVAGAMAEFVGRDLRAYGGDVVVENGGDLWLAVAEPVTVQVYTTNIWFRDRLAIRIAPEETPCGVATSSATIGPSISLGRADAATVVAADAALADALATAAGNRVRGEDDLAAAVDLAVERGARGALAVFRDRLALRGELTLTQLPSEVLT